MLSLVLAVIVEDPYAPGPRPLIAPYTFERLPDRGTRVPMIFPVLGSHRMRNGYNEDRGSHRHTGIDINARKMTPVVAPFNGVVGFKVNTVWVYGDTGIFILGTHLNNDTPGTNDNTAQPDYMFAPNLRKGDRVIAGQHLGYIGDSGDATGPHLHFELFGKDQIITSPWKSLKQAQRLVAARPAAQLENPAPGSIAVAGCVRKVDTATKTVTLLLTATRKHNKYATAVTFPRWMKLKFTSGVEEFSTVPRDRDVIAEVRPDATGQTASVLRAVPPLN